jgi:two-component system NarL family sensor kinase
MASKPRTARKIESASLAEAFLEQSPACNWLVASDLKFARVYGDPAGLFGKSAAELTGKTVAEVLDPEAAALWTGRLERTLAGEHLMLRERRIGSLWNVSLFPVRTRDGLYAGAMARDATPWNNAEQELRHTVLGALEKQEFARTMASKFLHDVVGQNLTAFGLQLDLLRMDLETVSPEDCGRLAEIQKILEEMMEAVREYSYELNPSTVERAGLRTALDRLAERIPERFGGALRLNVDPSLKLERKVAAAIYRVAKEAVENSVQHSGCSIIEIAVKSSRNGTFLEVKDNGKGFDPADLESGSRGLGLLSMEHYAAEAGLDLSITSHRGKGTIVRAAEPGVG